MQAELTRFEILVTAQRFLELLLAGRFSVRHYRAVHRHIFQNVYRWAGRFRTVRISRRAGKADVSEIVVLRARSAA